MPKTAQGYKKCSFQIAQAQRLKSMTHFSTGGAGSYK